MRARLHLCRFLRMPDTLARNLLPLISVQQTVLMSGIPVQTVGTAAVYDVTHPPENPKAVEEFGDADMKKTAKAAAAALGASS